MDKSSKELMNWGKRGGAVLKIQAKGSLALRVAETITVYKILHPISKKTAGPFENPGRAFKETSIFILTPLVPSRGLDTMYMLNKCLLNKWPKRPRISYSLCLNSSSFNNYLCNANLDFLKSGSQIQGV